MSPAVADLFRQEQQRERETSLLAKREAELQAQHAAELQAQHREAARVMQASA